MREMPSQLIHHPLRGTVRIASSIVRRHLRHQLVNVRFDDGRSRIRADLDTALGLQLYRYGLEDPDLAAVGRLLGPGDFFIDGGAQVGLFTLVAASRVGPSGLVVACEPAPATRGRLIDNLELNDFSWVTPLGVALSDRRSSAQFVAFDGNGSGLSSFAPAPDVEGGSSMTVHTSTLDEIAGDRIPTLESDPQWGWVDYGLRRTYAMNSVGPNWGTDYQVAVTAQGYPPLPDLNVAGRHGVGIYWTGGGSAGLPDWDAKGYKTSVVGDPAGTILLVEEPNIQNVAGNIWPCICIGPQGQGDLYQVDPSPDAKNFGNNTYGIHSKRFNYLFHDNHVQALKIEQTVGTGTLANPKGMWTVTKGD